MKKRIEVKKKLAFYKCALLNKYVMHLLYEISEKS